jgi:hypothetical protein
MYGFQEELHAQAINSHRHFMYACVPEVYFMDLIFVYTVTVTITLY